MSKFNIQVNETTSPNIVKFTANTFIAPSKSYEFHNIDEAKESPLAQQLFHLPFVKTVYISQNFIAIEKYDIVAWTDVQDEVATSIEAYLNAGKTALVEQPKKMPTTIYAESTPNPAAMKFVANRKLAEKPLEFKNPEQTAASPLARALFNFPFVREVFITGNYVSILKYDLIEWEEITMEIREFLRRYLEEGKPILAETSEARENKNPSSKNGQKMYSAFEKEIVGILDEYVKPAVATDGGHIMLDSYSEDTQTVKVILQGACSGCPSSTLTLKNGIEAILKQMLPGQVEQVVAING